MRMPVVQKVSRVMRLVFLQHMRIRSSTGSTYDSSVTVVRQYMTQVALKVSQMMHLVCLQAVHVRPGAVHVRPGAVHVRPGAVHGSTWVEAQRLLLTCLRARAWSVSPHHPQRDSICPDNVTITGQAYAACSPVCVNGVAHHITHSLPTLLSNTLRQCCRHGMAQGVSCRQGRQAGRQSTVAHWEVAALSILPQQHVAACEHAFKSYHKRT
jgi:hypothetical protein